MLMFLDVEEVVKIKLCLDMREIFKFLIKLEYFYLMYLLE